MEILYKKFLLVVIVLSTAACASGLQINLVTTMITLTGHRITLQRQMRMNVVEKPIVMHLRQSGI